MIDKNQKTSTWTDEDDQTLKELADGGLSAKDIADLLNRSVEEVAKRKLDIAAAESKMRVAIQETPKETPVKSVTAVEPVEMNAIEKAFVTDKNKTAQSATGRKLSDNETLFGNFIIKKSRK